MNQNIIYEIFIKISKYLKNLLIPKKVNPPNLYFQLNYFLLLPLL